MIISHQLLQPSGSHARYHHPQSHEGCADGIMCRFVFSGGKVNEVKHISSKSEPVTELLDKDADVN